MDAGTPPPAAPSPQAPRPAHGEGPGTAAEQGPESRRRSPADTDRSTARGRGPEARAAAVLVPAVLGAAGLFVSSQSAKGSTTFYVATFCVAAVYFLAWFLLGRPREDVSGGRPWKDLALGLGLGAGLLAVFALGALMVRGVPLLADPVRDLLGNVRLGSVAPTVLTTAVNGVAEEAFFRGTAPRWLGGSERRRAVLSIGLYALVTCGMGVPLLVFAAVVLGALTWWLARRTGALIAPTALHLTWSLGMLAVLPPLVGA